MTATDILLLHLAVTWALVGLIWTVQVVQYPGFAFVGRKEFATYHEQHCARITWIVGPLMALELLTGLVLLAHRPPGLSTTVLWVGLYLILLNAVWTAFVAVPLHRRLGGQAREQQDKLVTANWVRTLAWSARGIWALLALRAVIEPL